MSGRFREDMSNFIALRSLCVLLFTVFIARAQAQSSSPCQYDKLFDFEDSTPGQERCFQTPSSSGSVTLSTDPTTVKHGEKSLKWTATRASTLQLKSTSSSVFTLPNRWIRHGGIKVWIYKESSSPGKELEVEFKDSARTKTVASFKANLNFEGWRGIWVRFGETKANSLNRPAVIDEVNFVLSDADTIFIDAIKFERDLARQTRDKIVPPMRKIYNKKHFWQQSYYWSQKTPFPNLPSTIDEKKKKSLDHIKSRLRNFYCDETKATSKFPNDSFLKKRWVSILKTAEKAHQKYKTELKFRGEKIVGPPLSCRNCKLGKKFGDVFVEILKPLALEYYIRSRTNEVDDAAEKLSEIKEGDKSGFRKTQIAITGKDSTMKSLFASYLSSTRPLEKVHVISAINKLNAARLGNINKILDYVAQQGFADGSGLGSLEFEMNRDSAGFMHSLFLISEALSSSSSKSKLLDLIKTAKWYNDFGEVYQTLPYVFKGTTADRMITTMFNRLIIVMVMPNDNDNEMKTKIRDMDAVVSWMNNALSVNEALGGVIKPDFTGFHHQGFYASAYVPQAMHIAAFVQYLLGGTEFALSPSSTDNVRRVMETMRLVAVKYSTPASVNGRFPKYFGKELIKSILPGYAYISVSYPSLLPDKITKGISVSKLNQANAQMFLRLYNINDPDVQEYLKDGRPRKKKDYFNSLGSLDIMEAVRSAATSQNISPEPSPEGHWSKNFAALSIHRRKDWVVTVKGFNRFVWDFELGVKNQNVYGLFASHGALQIANSEKALEVHDIKNGWDWAKVPGTTTIDFGRKNMDDLKMDAARFYNKHKLAGSLTFKGTMCLANGVFGMGFRQPSYKFPSRSDWRKQINFRFKKSVFSFENLMVCLGSGINTKDKSKRSKVHAQTTLFQDKIGSSLTIKVDGVQKGSSTYNHVPSTTKSHTTLTDAKGNFYYVPDPSKKILKVSVKTQDSIAEDGKKATCGNYGTAWFEHSSSHKSYQYAVLIPTTSYHTALSDLATDQESKEKGRKIYNVLKYDDKAHVVQFLKSPRTWSVLSAPITGYVIFDKKNLSLPPKGPVKAVSRRNCLIMAEETERSIYLSVSYPDLDFPVKKYPVDIGDMNEKLLYDVTSKRNSVTVTLRKQVTTTIASKQVHGTPTGYKPNVEIGSNGKEIHFNDLKNGFSIEVELTRV